MLRKPGPSSETLFMSSASINLNIIISPRSLGLYEIAFPRTIAAFVEKSPWFCLLGRSTTILFMLIGCLKFLSSTSSLTIFRILSLKILIMSNARSLRFLFTFYSYFVKHL